MNRNYGMMSLTEMYHHGIKGMKWNKRRYQNKDGSLTEEGKRRYYGLMYDDKFDPAREKAKEKLRELHEKGKENLTLKPKSKEQYDYYDDRPDALSRKDLEARKKKYDLSEKKAQALKKIEMQNKKRGMTSERVKKEFVKNYAKRTVKSLLT